MLAHNAWLLLPDRFRDLLEFVYCSHVGEIWLFNNDLLVFQTPELFEELYSDIIDHSPLRKNIRSVKLFLSESAMKEFTRENGKVFRNLCNLSPARLKTFYVGKIPDQAFQKLENAEPPIPPDVPYVFYTARGTLHGSAAGYGVILVRPTDHPFRDSGSQDRDHLAVCWRVQDDTQATIEARGRLAKLFDGWFNDLALFKSIEPHVTGGKVDSLELIDPRSRQDIEEIWHAEDPELRLDTSPPRRPKRAPSVVDLAVVTALEEESVAIETNLKDVHRISVDDRLYRVGYFVTKAGKVFRVAVCSSETTGSVAAALVTNDVIRTFRPSGVVLLGIAAGRRREGASGNEDEDEPQLGDVVYATDVSPYEYTKIKTVGSQDKSETGGSANGAVNDEGADVTREERTRPCSGFLVSVAKEVARAWAALPPQVQGWQDDQRAPRVFGGTIASGSKVIADAETARAIARAEIRWNRKLIAIEMEGEGVAEAARKRGVQFIIVKGISDYADQNKNDQWHVAASNAAAAFFSEMLEVIATSQW